MSLLYSFLEAKNKITWLCKGIASLVFFLVWLTTAAQAQTTVSGKITDQESTEGLVGASVYIKGTSSGATTDTEGNFSFQTSVPFPFTLVISSVGYATQEAIITDASQAGAVSIAVGQSAFLADEVVVSASRRAEKITEAPSTISIINAKAIDELPSFNVGELAARQKGVDYVRSGVLGTGINVRGFNSAFNPKNLQLNDNRFSTLVATGLPLGALSTVVKEDIERIEIILGPSSALYGPNAHNGLVNTISKDPRTSQGTTIALGAGNQNVFSARFRHAQVISKKLAFKVSGDYTEGQEFNYVDTVYNATGTRAFSELDLNRNFNSLRGEAAVYYSVNDRSDLILSYGASNSNNLGVTNAGRNQIKDWSIQYLHLRYVSPRWFAQLYHTWSFTDKTYAINQRTQNYQSFVDAGFSDEEARQRSFAEQWLANPLLPGGGLSLSRGALFRDDSRRWNAEVQYNNNWGGFNVIVGAQWQRDDANSKGTYLLDNNGKGIVINQIGPYFQVEKPFLSSIGLKAVIASRFDYHDLYGFNFVPKAGLLRIGEKGTWRITYGRGIAAPTILNLEANIFGGLLLGNGQGYTLSTGERIGKLQVETIQTFEVGYKGTLIDKKLFVDANAYYNISDNFLSPAINIARPGVTVTQRGNQNMSDVIPGTPATGATTVLTYVNFGNVNTWGVDVGITYAPISKLNIVANYSYFGYSLNKGDLKNDGDRNGIVNDIDLPINTPSHKASLAFNGNFGKFFGSLFVRWVDAYDFFSGINIAARSNSNLLVGGQPLTTNARAGRTWNYGPLAGFVNVDLSLGYRFGKWVTLSGQVVNLFDAKVREFVASPFIGRLFSLELKVNLPAINPIGGGGIKKK